MEYYWWEKMIALPIRRLCRGLAGRLGFRKNEKAQRLIGVNVSKSRWEDDGLLMLSQEIQACEYEDVQIMWEMLKKNESNEVIVSHSPTWTKSKHLQKILSWARCASPGGLNKKF